MDRRWRDESVCVCVWGEAVDNIFFHSRAKKWLKRAAFLLLRPRNSTCVRQGPDQET